jgi:hypothetical protein
MIFLVLYRSLLKVFLFCLLDTCRRSTWLSERVDDFVGLTGVIVMGCVLADKTSEKMRESGQSGGSRDEGYDAR